MNSVVGGLGQNVETLQRLRTQAAAVGASLVVSPELALTGYPPEDLLLKEGFCDAARRSLDELAGAQNAPPMLVGTVLSEGDGVVLAPSMDGRDVTRLMNEGRVIAPHIANVLAAVSGAGVGPIATKRLLPNYDVFDEQRYFHPGLGEGWAC
jgi:predicted amidohydrolase